MSKLLYVVASPRQQRSFSIHIADAFIDAYRKHHPTDSITTLDLFRIDLPAFDGNVINAKYAILHGQNPSPEEKAEWKAVEDLIADFKSADKFVLAVPMWNFGIPYQLKQYIDILVQPTYTFSFSPDKGYTGLVTGRPAFIAYARGGSYAGADPNVFDFQKRYLEFIFSFIGLTDIRSLIMEDALNPDRENAKARRDNLADQARKMALDF